MNKELTPAEKKAMDSLLKEAIGNAQPPDLSKQILNRLHNQTTIDDSGPIVCVEDRTLSQQGSVSPKQIGMVLGLITALAASFMMAIWLRPDRTDRSAESSPMAVETAELNLPTQSPAPPAPESTPPTEPTELSPVRKPPRGIQLDIASSDPEESSGAVNESVESPTSAQPVKAISLVSTQVESDLRRYWDAIGIEPTDTANNEKVAARLSELLGVQLPADAVDDPQRLQAQLRRKSVANAVSRTWLRAITERGILRVDAETRNKLFAELAACFRNEKEFDQVLSDWISGKSPQSGPFFQALAAGPGHARGDAVMMRRLASLTMSIDLRCTRCHDSYIEGTGLQSDHWAFAAFLKRGVKFGPGGKVSFDVSDRSDNPLFYELPDGRQQVAEPAISQSWIRSDQDQPIQSMKDWSRRLVGSKELARGVVNSLWQLVHGQPLRGRVVDPISAPRDESLDRLESELISDLVRSNFDVARTLALIISSPATRCRVPDALLPENALVVKQSDSEKARAAVNAFAASMPPHTSLPLNQRLDQALRSSGGKLDSDGKDIVAQIGSANRPKRKVEIDSLAADFPGRAETLPVQWLARLQDETSQAKHLGYLAGMSTLPENVLNASQRMSKSDGKNTALHRVWWMVRP